MKPNYKKYSESQLRDVLRVIDRERYPERVAEIEAILGNPIQRKRARRIDSSKQAAKKETQRKNREFAVIAKPVLLLFSAVLAYFPGRNMLVSANIERDMAVLFLIVLLVVAGIVFLHQLTKK